MGTGEWNHLQPQWRKCLAGRSYERKGSSLQSESTVHNGREIMVERAKAVGKLRPLPGNREI